MLSRDDLSPHDEQLLPLVIAIADGTPVDWSSAPPHLLHQLQHLERLVRGHEAVRSSPAHHHDSSARETLLTEARRKGDKSEGPLQVRWGPLIVHEKIGRGSFGDVYRAWDPRLDREVALKLIPENTSGSDASPVVDEGRLLARVRHPNVMVVYGAERIDGRVGIWTEYIRGETLASEVARRGPLPPQEAARVGVDVCAALGAVHAAGLLHRDVKAQNILRDATGRIVLGDFGTGVELTDAARVSDPSIAGTPLYLAPEVLDGQPGTVASDLYAVGVLLYFLLTGTFPVQGRTLAEIRRAHAACQHASLRAVRADLPEGLVHAIESLLAIDPDGRYSSAAAAEAALQHFTAQPIAIQPPSRRRLATAAVAGAIVLGGIVSGAVWESRSRDSRVDPRPSAASFAPKAGDWIVVTDIDNQTGDSVLDGTLRAAIERELEYSDYVRVVQRDRIEDALKLLQHPLDSQIDRDLAVELSQRDGGIRAVIAGTIANAATGYTLTFDVINPATRTPVTTLTDHAPGQADILAAVRRQTLRIREALREPAASLERGRDALQAAALPSLKAASLVAQVRATIDARRPGPLSDWNRVEKIARDVLQEDPSYVAGHALLAWAMRMQGHNEEAVQHAERAIGLADDATPQERYFVLATVHQFKGWGPAGPPTVADRQELEKAAAAMEALFALQPDHYFLRDQLPKVYRALGRERDLAWMNLRLADARPWSIGLNLDVARQLLREGNVDGARRYGARAESALVPGAAAANPDVAASVRLFPAYVAWLQDDPEGTLRLLDQVASSVDRLAGGERRQVLRRLWTMYAGVGRLRQAEQAIEAARAHDPGDFVYALNTDLARAELFVERGDLRGLRAFVEARWNEPLPGAAPPFAARRLMYAIDAGLLDAAERDLAWFKRRTAQASAFAPGILTRQFEPFHASSAGALAFARGRPDVGVALLEQALPAIRQGPPVVLSAGGSQGQYAAVTLATALEAVGNVSDAIATLEQAVEDRVGVTIGNTPNRWLRTSAQLARLYRRNKQEEKARAVEAHLLKLLAAADVAHPLVTDLRRRERQTRDDRARSPQVCRWGRHARGATWALLFPNCSPKGRCSRCAPIRHIVL